MILRKPYAILIKNFKFIHMIITFCMAYLLYNTYTIYNYIGSYMSTSMLAVHEDVSSQLFNIWVTILPFIIIVGLIILLIVMLRKKKPFLFYIINIIIYVATIVVNSYLLKTIDYTETNIIEIKQMQFAKDICFMLLIVQLISVILTSIRAFGFDIKKFDFGKDLVDLDIAEEDAEEFEVNVNVETGAIKREFNKKLRMAKYVYLENKLIINIIIVIFTCILGYFVYNSVNVYNADYSEGSNFYSNGLELGVEKTFVTQQKYNGSSIIKDDKYIVAIQLNVKASTNGETLNTAKTILEVGNKEYYPTSIEYRTSIFDLGQTYYKNKLNKKTQKFLLVYEVPKKKVNKKIKFKYLNDVTAGKDKSQPKYINVKLNPIFIDDNVKEKDTELEETIVLNEDLLGKTAITINSFDLKEEFMIKYHYCLGNICYESYEYIKAPLTKNYDEAILKINAELEKDDEKTFKELYDLYSLISYYGVLEYQIDNQTYKINNLEKVVPTRVEQGNNYYFTVNKDVLMADKINLYIKVRNKSYKYKIK